MLKKTLSSKPKIYLGIGRNKYYGVTSDNSNTPIEFFPYGLFLRLSKNPKKIEESIYDFFDNSAQMSLSPSQREVLLLSQLYELDYYIDCYFKTPTIIYAFLEKFNQTFVFIESGSNIIINKQILTARMQSLTQGE